MEREMRFALFVFAAGLALGQPKSISNTSVGANESVDYGAAAATRPVKVGTSTPGTCSVGYLFFKSDATAGQNVYGCTSTNTWTAQAGGGGASTKQVVFQGGGFNLGNAYSGGIAGTNTAGTVTDSYTSRYIGVSTFPDAGATGSITWAYPTTWDGNAVTLKLILAPLDAVGGDITFTPYATCLVDGVDIRNGTYTAGTPGTVAAGSVQFGRINLTLTVPVGSCVAGSPVIISIDRSASDTYANTVDLVLAVVTGTW